MYGDFDYTLHDVLITVDYVFDFIGSEAEVTVILFRAAGSRARVIRGYAFNQFSRTALKARCLGDTGQPVTTEERKWQKAYFR